MMKDEILRIQNVTKRIDGITYLDNINFHVLKGDIMGLIPLDKHGETQLIELICQNVSIDFGRVYFNEELVNYYGHSNMDNNKVYCIDKDIKLVQDLRVTDNIYVLNSNFKEFIIRERRIKGKTDELLKNIGIKIETDEYVSELSSFEKTVIELIKAVTNGAQLIILNELSNFLSMEELADFHKLIIYYAKQGFSFLYLANHHEEAFKICDRVCLIEHGSIIKVVDNKDFSKDVLKPYIISFDNRAEFNELSKESGIFEFTNLITENLKDISFSIKKSECITILDINNKGLRDIVDILNGLIIPLGGKIVLNNNSIEFNELLLKGVAFIPENPISKTLFHDMSYMENLTFLMDRKLDKTFIKRKILKNIKEEYRSLAGNEVDARDLRDVDIKSLYNLVYFRLHIYNPKVVFIMQPFSDADMYLRQRIINLINKLKEKGIAVIILAFSISDTLVVSDRLLIMEDGKILEKIYYKNKFNTIKR